jgi:glycosyltransferase involved in cell wall biosynthesis
MESRTLSLAVVIPTYNEIRFLPLLLGKLQQVLEVIESEGTRTEVIVVDDGSTDGTAEKLDKSWITFVAQKNMGKGSAVNLGVQHSQSEFFIVLDADGEYDPAEITNLLKASNGNVNRAVYGSRYLRSTGIIKLKLIPHKNQYITSLLFNYLLSTLNFLTKRIWISDLLTGYKLYPTELYRRMRPITHGFETDHELTRKLISIGAEIVEVPIRYYPRKKSDGKKIGSIDAIKAIKEILK